MVKSRSSRRKSFQRTHVKSVNNNTIKTDSKTKRKRNFFLDKCGDLFIYVKNKLDLLRSGLLCALHKIFLRPKSRVDSDEALVSTFVLRQKCVPELFSQFRVFHSSDIMRLIGDYLCVADIANFRAVSKDYREVVRLVFYDVLRGNLRSHKFLVGKLTEKIAFVPNPHEIQTMAVSTALIKYEGYFLTKSWLPDQNYIARIQGHGRQQCSCCLSERMRCNVVDWMIGNTRVNTLVICRVNFRRCIFAEVCLELGLSMAVASSAVMLMDRFLSIVVVPRCLKLVCILPSF